MKSDGNPVYHISGYNVLPMHIIPGIIICTLKTTVTITYTYTCTYTYIVDGQECGTQLNCNDCIDIAGCAWCSVSNSCPNCCIFHTELLQKFVGGMVLGIHIIGPVVIFFT